MRSTVISYLLLSFVLISCFGAKAQVDKNQRFIKHTGVEWAGLKGKVKSIITYRCRLSDSAEHCSVFIYKYDKQGFLIEEIDTVGPYFSSDKYFRSNGLLAKHIYAASAPFPPLVDTYLYSFSEGKQTCITRHPDDSSGTIDTSMSIYDQIGNEMEYVGDKTFRTNKYDKRGFLTWSRTIMPDGKAFEVTYENDDKGRILKQTWWDGRGAQGHVYDKDGNEIQQMNYDSLGRKTSDYFTGYCEFDEKGNFLKSISFSPQTKDMGITRRVIEYY